MYKCCTMYNSEVHDVGARLDAARGAVSGGHQLVRGGAGRARHGGRGRRVGGRRHGRARGRRRARRPARAGTRTQPHTHTRAQTRTRFEVYMYIQIQIILFEIGIQDSFSERQKHYLLK